MAAVCKLDAPPVRARPAGEPRGGTARTAVATRVAALVVAGAVAVAGAAESAVSSALPDLVRTTHRVFSIPFRLPPPQTPDAAPQRVVLSVSKDLGVTWSQAAESAPNAGSFTYRAEADGEYWFQLRSIDAKGRSRGGAGPDLRVLVDAAGPTIAARVWKGGDGEIVCRYAALDDSLRLDSLAVEYRTKGDPGWKKLTAEGILSRESPAHLVGEEIWWAGEQVETLTVRIAVADASGNRAEKQFTLERSDPHVDQAALARELGAPPLPSREQPLAADGRPAAAPPGPEPGPSGPRAVVAVAPAGRARDAWPAEHATRWPAEAPRPDAVRSSGTMFPAGVSPGAAPPLAETAAAPGGHPPEYRGKPLRLVRSRRFAWDYGFPSDPAGTPVRVELWSTRDGGVTWQRSAVDDDAQSPINVALPTAGLYGFRLDILPDLPDIGGGPQPGEAPDCWLAVDDEPPVVDLVEVGRAKPGEPVGMVIRYAAHDQMLAPDSVRIAYAQHADGPWTTIADGLATQGTHHWQPPRTTPARVHVRVEAADAAGNVGFATSAGAVAVATPRVTGSLGGVTALPVGQP